MADDPAPPLRSAFADDPDFAVVLDPYLAGLPEKRAALRTAAAALPGDATPLRRLAHQVKGAAGGYGFPQVTDAAGTLVAAIDGGDSASTRDAVRRLLALMERMPG